MTSDFPSAPFVEFPHPNRPHRPAEMQARQGPVHYPPQSVPNSSTDSGNHRLKKILRFLFHRGHHCWESRSIKAVIMEVTAAVLYGGKLAHYDVSVRNDGTCDARLTAFKGSAQSAPPERLTLRKEGRHWVSNVPDKDLSEDIGYAVEIKVPQDMMAVSSRRRDSANPAS
jgi:hypothetical protein